MLYIKQKGKIVLEIYMYVGKHKQKRGNVTWKHKWQTGLVLGISFLY